MTQPILSATADAVADPSQSSNRHAKLLHAAQQFEAVMLGELMKPLSTSTSIDGDSDGEKSNALQGFGVEAMAGAMARSGALGIANRIVQSVEQHTANKLSQKNAENIQVLQQAADNSRGGN